MNWIVVYWWSAIYKKVGDLSFPHTHTHTCCDLKNLAKTGRPQAEKKRIWTQKWRVDHSAVPRWDSTRPSTFVFGWNRLQGRGVKWHEFLWFEISSTRKTRCYLHFWIAPQTHRSSVWLTFNPKTDNKSKHLIAATARTPWFARRWWCCPGSRLRRESDSNCLALCWFGLHAKIPAITKQIQSHKLSRDWQKSDRIFSIDFLKHGLWQRLLSYLCKIENFIFRRPF